MHVLLVYPEFPQTFWSFDRALELVGRKVLLPPLGLITVAALLPERWELRLVDENIRPVSKADWDWADLVIVSAMLVQKRGLARLIARARQSRIPVAVGGPFATSTPEAPELALANFLILDEGEITIPRWIEAIEKGAKKGRFSAEGEKPDISLSPIPRFDLLERKAYDMMAVQFSRGCPFQCEFCDIIVLYGRKPRTKSPDQLLAELDALRTLRWHGSIFLVDDNFIGNKRNVQQLLPKLKAWQRQHGFPFSFTTEASVDLAADPDLIDQMVDCGFQRVFLGIETPDTASLRGAGKLQNTRSPLEEAVATITGRG
ncbi:MAG: B12-binding domain-containing radical SAM protein, partial [Cyanobacteriota bacterium]